MVLLWRCMIDCRRTALLFFSAIVFCATFAIGSSSQNFKKRSIQLGTKTLVVEVAETSQEHEKGLMFREKLGPQEGMLFIFKDEQVRSFWMKNTLLDLSIGFFDKSGRLIDIQEMKSGKGVSDFMLPSYESAKPAMYALEMNKGWFAKNGIKIGTQMKLQ